MKKIIVTQNSILTIDYTANTVHRHIIPEFNKPFPGWDGQVLEFRSVDPLMVNAYTRIQFVPTDENHDLAGGYMMFTPLQIIDIPGEADVEQVSLEDIGY